MFKNIASTVFSHYSSQAVGLLTNILLARYLGSEGFGEYTLASSVFLIGYAFTTFGMDMVLIRTLSLDFDSLLLGDGLLLQLILSFIYIAGVYVFDIFVPVPYSLKLFVLSLLPFAFYSIFTIVVRARQDLQTYAVGQFLIAFLQLIAVAVSPLFQGDLNTIIYLYLLFYIFIAAWGYKFYTVAFVRINFSISRLLALLRQCGEMAVIGTIRLIYEKIPATLISGIVGLSLTGIFSIASRMAISGKLGYFSAFTAIYPEMARDSEFGRKMRGLIPMLGTSVLFSLFLFLFAKPIIYILFGNEYVSAALPLQIMAWSIVPYVLVTYTSLGLVTMGLEKPILVCASIALLSLLIFLVVFTFEFGIVGSAVAVLAAELFYAALLWWQWRTHVLSKLP